jgi:hypothetical protein
VDGTLLEAWASMKSFSPIARKKINSNLLQFFNILLRQLTRTVRKVLDEKEPAHLSVNA